MCKYVTNNTANRSVNSYFNMVLIISLKMHDLLYYLQHEFSTKYKLLLKLLIFWTEAACHPCKYT